MSNNSKSSSGAVTGNSQNVPTAVVPRSRSTFPLHYHFFNTHRFGEYTPHYVDDLNKDENFPIHSSSQLRSYTLESPLMQNIKRNKDYFLVPLEAILPLNWEKYFDNPVRGDDVADDVGPCVAGFWTKVASFMTSLDLALVAVIADTSATDSDRLQALLRWLIIGEYFYSDGNLLASLGCHGRPYFDQSATGVDKTSWDAMFDILINKVSSVVTSFTLVVDGYSYAVSNTQHLVGKPSISLRHALCLMRDNPTATISGYVGAPFTSDIAPTFTSFTRYYHNGDVPMDLSRPWAYQLCCAHYFSNDHIDFVYSAELYRQLIGHYLKRCYNSTTWYSSFYFTRNGINYQYDYLSAHGCSRVLNLLSGASTVLTSGSDLQALSILGYLSALFGYRRSLRYLDYFTGTRAQPLAVAGNVPGGNQTSVPVSGGSVSVIDITKSIQAQRYLNAVNRVRHSFEGYLKGIFGGKMPAPDYHNPFYVAHTDDTIYGQETENTGAAQMSNDIAVTTNLRGNSGRYMFDVQSDRPCIVIGITSYDITRVYAKGTERAFFKQNRFDYFNPFMQYIGDQPVYLQELGISPGSGYPLATMSNFAYSLRHMEYKQRYSQCAGGFCDNLPGWAFLASDERGNQMTINPDWIRCVQSEFDNFYVSLTGWSLASYWHFIVDDFNSVNASRPMSYAPSIL